MTSDPLLTGATQRTRLRELIAVSGMTYDGLARAITVVARENGDHGTRPNRSSIAHWVAGHTPSRQRQAYVREALSRRLGRPLAVAELGFDIEDDDDQLGLSLTEDPVSTLRHLADADLRRRSFLTHAAYSVLALATVVTPGIGASPASAQAQALARTSRPVLKPGHRVGAGDVAAVRDVTAALTALDERLGGRHGRDTVTTWLAQDVTTLCRGPFVADAVRQSMFSAAAEVAYLAGWKAYDAGLESVAQRYYLQAYHLANQAADQGHSAYVLRIMAHHALDIHQPRHSVAAAEEAWRRSQHYGPELRSLYAFTVSRAHAATGDPHQAGTWLARAETLTAHEDDSQPPSWVSLGGSPQARMASQGAKTLTALGRHRAAEPFYARTANRWNPGTHPRVLALALNNLGRAQVDQGHLEQACATWTRAVAGLSLAAHTSARAHRALADIRSTLGQPRHRTNRSARELTELLAAQSPPASTALQT